MEETPPGRALFPGGDRELQFALARIRAGTYGVCRATGQLIPKERLRLVPHTTLSMAGKQGVAAR